MGYIGSLMCIEFPSNQWFISLDKKFDLVMPLPKQTDKSPNLSHVCHPPLQVCLNELQLSDGTRLKTGGGGEVLPLLFNSSISFSWNHHTNPNPSGPGDWWEAPILNLFICSSYQLQELCQSCISTLADDGLLQLYQFAIVVQTLLSILLKVSSFIGGKSLSLGHWR